MRELRTHPVPVLKGIMTRAIIYTDGAARGNPGPAALGVVIKDEQNKILACLSRRLGVTTNNQAEYRALIAGLQQAISLGAKEVEIRSDSELMVRQLTGRYRVKNAGLKPLYDEAVKLLSRFTRCSYVNIPREQNCEADALANRALDSH
ncbi:MAG: ribonuclease HI family protein [Dehalococcoidales bacterium]|nr:ribonuclease HI family protein [Dehalococcoidales bacterium]